MSEAINPINNYIDAFPADVQKILKVMKSAILEIIPNAQEVISYGIPTFDINGKHVVHFAGFKNHIGFYPGSQAIEVFQNDLKNYKTSKGTIQFPIDKPMPIELVQKITKYRLENI